jgi:hypothetical protein
VTFKDEDLERRCMQVARVLAWIWMTVVILWGLAACDHKEFGWDQEQPGGGSGGSTQRLLDVTLEYDQVWHADYAQTYASTLHAYDWMRDWPDEVTYTDDGLDPLVPEGVTVYITPESGARYYANLQPDGGEVALAEGANDLLFRNNDTEYIEFTDDGSVTTMTATTRAVTRGSYLGNPYVNATVEEEQTVSQPDVLYVAHVQDLSVPDSTQATPLTVVMHPLVFTYVVNVEVEAGLQYVSLVRGALAGMAAGTRLWDGSPSTEVATVMFEAEMTPTGAEAAVRSFGTPADPDDAVTVRTYGLTLEFMLKNGNLVTRDVDVTDQVSVQPEGGMITVSGIRITDEEGQASGGFKLDVTDWGEYQDIYL